VTGSGDWEGEESLDIEWAHAIAPMANIDLFEATNDSGILGNLFTAAQTAAKTPGVVAVSMSWDDDDSQLAIDPVDSGLTKAQELNFDSTVFTTPTGHLGGGASVPDLSTSLVEAGSTVTFTAANTFTAGQSVTITGAVPAGFDGTYVIASATANSFTFTDSTSGLGTATAQATAAIDLAGGVTFLAAAGDNGAYDFFGDPTVIEAEYPTDSPNVVSVGGTALSVDGSGPNYTYGGEVAWGDGVNSGTDGGGGGGVATYESQPSYQSGVVSNSLATDEGAYTSNHRTFPDISLQAAPNSFGVEAGTGVPVYDSYDNGTSSPWTNGNGGTSLSTPMMAAFIAIADEGRAIVGVGSLDGATQTLPELYKLPAADFHDITSGSTGPSPQFAAATGYDLATGRGSPAGNLLIPGLIAYQPTVTNISPATGQAGTVVTITGTDLTGGTVVDFGTTPATNVVVNTAGTQITATSPAGTGVVNVTVTGPGGTSATSALDRFTYAAGPTVSGIAPTAGPLAGGTAVTITGSDLTGVEAVDFGSTAASLSSLTYNSNGTITINSPPESAGAVNITVKSALGTSPISAADTFTYLAAPTVSGVSPSAGPATGDTSVTITGTGFTASTTVDFGTTPATNVVVNTATQITATSPAGAGMVNVTVTTVSGTSATSPADRFGYAPVVSGVSPGLA
jgi:subtilase family serine protease